METNVNYTIVGAFVITLVALIILGIIWLSSGLSFQQYLTYKLYMRESVSGLSIDAPVEYNGVNVGTVKSISLDKRNVQLVEVLLSIQKGTPITRGTKATLNAKVLSGIASISLEDKGTDMTPLTPENGEEYPVINTAPSLYSRLDTTLTKINENFRKISDSIQSLLDEQNLKSIKQTLINIQTITATLAGDSQKIDSILKNTAIASEQLGPLIKSSTTTMQLIETQTIPAANQAISNLNAFSSNLSQVSQDLKQNPAVLIRGKGQPVLGPGEK